MENEHPGTGIVIHLLVARVNVRAAPKTAKICIYEFYRALQIA